MLLLAVKSEPGGRDVRGMSPCVNPLVLEPPSAEGHKLSHAEVSEMPVCHTGGALSCGLSYLFGFFSFVFSLLPF